MDDILIYATMPELLEKYTKQVLHKLHDHDPFLKAKKCEFNKDKVENLELVIEEGKVSTQPYKGGNFASLNKTVTAEQVAKLWLENLYEQLGLPDEFISNSSPQFAAHAFRELLKLLGITSKLSTAYHPQMDVAMEQVN